MTFPDADTMFGPRRNLIEYRNGELIEEDGQESEVSPRVAPPAEAPGEQPGLS